MSRIILISIASFLIATALYQTYIGALIVYCLSLPTSILTTIPWHYTLNALLEAGHDDFVNFLMKFDGTIVPIAFSLQIFAIQIWIRRKKTRINFPKAI